MKKITERSGMRLMRALEYPFDPQTILRKRRSIKRELLADGSVRIKKKIAVLGGSTTHDVIEILELFLLNVGIEPEFYESEFGRFYEDALFSEELRNFEPDIVYIHTSGRNITELPEAGDSDEAVDVKLKAVYAHFEAAWEALRRDLAAPIIQNNFEMPFYRLLGNRDGWDRRGRLNFVSRLNALFGEYARGHGGFYINDINYLSADYGLGRWSDPLYWHMYKYCLNLDAIPALAHNLAAIISSVYGGKKKALALDLDNTLWGGVVGDDGVEGLEIGHETSMGQVYSEFQRYLGELKSYGVMLNVDSKNDEANALAGLSHPEGTLKAEDFIVIKANWEPKDRNFEGIARELNILPESVVFVDDNPAERAIVTGRFAGVSAPELTSPERYIEVIDRNGYFEATEVSSDDLTRNEMYRANRQRAELERSFSDYRDYLLSLEMRAKIGPFEPVYLPRIAQLTNKSNQFNLTTRRYTEAQMRQIAGDPERVTLYGKLTDKFGDNGVVTVVIGRVDGESMDIELWLMSCRVLKRNMELAMLDALVKSARARGVRTLRGYYYRTAKNAMVREFYGELGFTKVGEDGEDTVWELDITDYKQKNDVIRTDEVE